MHNDWLKKFGHQNNSSTCHGQSICPILEDFFFFFIKWYSIKWYSNNVCIITLIPQLLGGVRYGRTFCSHITPAQCSIKMCDSARFKAVALENGNIGKSSRCKNMFTVQILCIGTDRSRQTVQTKIRLLLKKQSDQGLRCLPFHQHLF